MNPRVKALYITALRSGEYEAGEYYLKANGEHSALGVLCSVAVMDGVVEWIPSHDEDGSYYVGKELNNILLPAEVLAWAELKSPQFELPSMTAKHYRSITMEEEDKTFKEIADIVEEEL